MLRVTSFETSSGIPWMSPYLGSSLRQYQWFQRNCFRGTGVWFSLVTQCTDSRREQTLMLSPCFLILETLAVRWKQDKTVNQGGTNCVPRDSNTPVTNMTNMTLQYDHHHTRTKYCISNWSIYFRREGLKTHKIKLGFEQNLGGWLKWESKGYKAKCFFRANGCHSNLLYNLFFLEIQSKHLLKWASVI